MKLVFGTVLITLALLASSDAALDELQEPDNSIFFQHVYRPDRRIVGGEKAAEHTHKYMVALSEGTILRGLFCAGSLISQRTVLTAGHCITAAYSNGALSRSLRGSVGTLRWNKGGTSYAFSHNITYPHYVPATITNDIGLLITKTDVVLSDSVSILAMNFDFQGANVSVTVAGWGAIGADKVESDDLLVINTTIIDGSRCVEDAKAASNALKIRAPQVEPDIEICTYHKPDHGVCNGDSGGPLVRIEDDQQVGIVSWGFPCARGAPDIFARLSAYKEWVQQNIV